MTLEDLIAPIIDNPGVFPATLGTYFPRTIEYTGRIAGLFCQDVAGQRIHQTRGGRREPDLDCWQ